MTVAVVARSPSARIGLRVMLEEQPCLDVIAELGTPADLGHLAERPDVSVFEYDDEMIDEAVDECVRLVSGCVLLGGEPSLAARLSRLPLPGWALLTRDSTANEVSAAVQAVAAGLIVMSGQAVAAIEQASAAQTQSATDEADALTGREDEVLQALAAGLANKQIAARLGVSVHTVKFHVAAILAKLEASSRTEAVSLGVRRGLVRL